MPGYAAHRLKVMTVTLPPLRERREDVLLLTAHFIKEFNARVMTFYKDTRFTKTSPVPNFWQIGIGLQVQI